MTPTPPVSSVDQRQLKIMAAELRCAIADYRNPAIPSAATAEYLEQMELRVDLLSRAAEALSTTPTQSIEVTEAMVERGAQAFSDHINHSSAHIGGPSKAMRHHHDFARVVLTAAISQSKG